MEEEIRERVPGITSPHISSGGQDVGSSKKESRCPGGKVAKKHHNPRQGHQGPDLRPEGTLHTCLGGFPVHRREDPPRELLLPADPHLDPALRVSAQRVSRLAP